MGGSHRVSHSMDSTIACVRTIVCHHYLIRVFKVYLLQGYRFCVYLDIISLDNSIL